MQWQAALKQDSLCEVELLVFLYRFGIAFLARIHSLFYAGYIVEVFPHLGFICIPPGKELGLLHGHACKSVL